MTRFTCSNTPSCGEPAWRCACAEHIAAEMPRLCESCASAPVFDGTDECVACIAAYCIHVDPMNLDSWRKVHAGTPELAALEAEVARQSSALLACGRAA